MTKRLSRLPFASAVQPRSLTARAGGALSVALSSAALVAGVGALCVCRAGAQKPAQSGVATMTVDAGDAVHPVSPTLYGLMTEEINHSYDGGLYAELLNDRTMHRIWSGVDAWTLVQRGDAQASMHLDTKNGPSAALTSSLAVTATQAAPGSEAGVSNPGYWGILVQPRTTYKGSLWAQSADGAVGPVTAKLISDDTGAVLAQAVIPVAPGPWKHYDFALTTGNLSESARNHFELTFAHSGTLALQVVSLFPPTYHDRPGGFRKDLMEKMAEMHPTFLRLPGGNYLEGDTIAERFQWKKTIGPMADRPGHQGPWNYWSTDGMGLLEFLEWCEDLKIEPVLAVYAGYSLKGAHVTPGADFAPYVQDALEEVEYVTGDVSTPWGKKRAEDGHPAPFKLHYIEIGNEDWFDKSGSYEARFAQMAKALRAKYPQYKLISTAPLKNEPQGAEADVVDDHYYKSPADMFALVHQYDNASRTGPKVFVGEWATRSGSPTPNFGDALGDAAWMTSMERNSDLIVMASYAPLLVNVNPSAMQWATDLIGFDAATSYGSPSFYAQSLFAAHLGDQVVRSAVVGAGPRFFESATVSSADHMLHLKLVNASSMDQPLALQLNGVKSGKVAAVVTTLHGASYEATNSITMPGAVKPANSTLKLNGPTLAHTVPALTIEVIDIPLK